MNHQFFRIESARDDVLLRQALQIGARGGRYPRQVVQSSDLVRFQARLIEQAAVVGNPFVGVPDKRAKLARLVLPDLLAIPFRHQSGASRDPPAGEHAPFYN